MLIGFVGGIKLKNGAIFIFGAKAGHALTAIDIKKPKRDTVKTGDARQKTGKWPDLLEVFDNKSRLIIKTEGC